MDREEPMDTTPLLDDSNISLAGSSIREQNEPEEMILEPVLIKQLEDDGEPGRLRRSSMSDIQDFHVFVKVLEGKELPGLDINPIVKLEIGGKKKSSAVKESTCAPFYDEYFVFKFKESKVKLMDKILTISCFNDKGVLQKNDLLGNFSMDLGTLFEEPGYQFIDKWVPLTAENGESKGFLHLDVGVLFDIEETSGGNNEDGKELYKTSLFSGPHLCQRQLLQLKLSIFRGDGLPRAVSGIGTSLKKAFSPGNKELVNPYAVVTWGSLKAETQVQKKTTAPVWNQAILFTHLFPTLFQKIKVQIFYSETGADQLIATGFIQIKDISSSSEDGFPPTFGPAFVHLYGAPRDSDDEALEDLNKGIGEGLAYRGRILISITTEVLEDVGEEVGVSVEAISPLQDESKIFGPSHEFLLHASILNSIGIPKKYSDKTISYTISMGDPEDVDGNGVVEDGEKKLAITGPSSSLPVKPDKCIGNKIKPTDDDMEGEYYLPYNELKPCIWVKYISPEFRKRIFISNTLQFIAKNLDLGLRDVAVMEDNGHDNSLGRFKGVLYEFKNYFPSLNHLLAELGHRGTQLDRQRIHIIQSTIQELEEKVTELMNNTNKSSIRDSINDATIWAERLRTLSTEPQGTYPDIFIVMRAGGKEIATARLPINDYVYSSKPHERGRKCSTPNMILFFDRDDVRSLVQISVWFGNIHEISSAALLNNLPSGFDQSEIALDSVRLPMKIKYLHCHAMEFRCHLFQARSLHAADSTGFSDPYAIIHFNNCCIKSRIVESSLSPVWDQLLIPDKPVIVYGETNDLISRKNQIQAFIEIYDKDMVGDDELIGRSIINLSSIRFSEKNYNLPKLSWVDIWFKGQEAGQLLIAIELLQLNEGDADDAYPKALPSIKQLKSLEPAFIPVPSLIRPTLSPFRLRVLFWGLREIEKTPFSSIDKPRIEVEIGGRLLASSTLTSPKKMPNFTCGVKELEIELPDQEFLSPPLSITLLDIRAFGRNAVISHLEVPLIGQFFAKWEETNNIKTIFLSSFRKHKSINAGLIDISIDMDGKYKENQGFKEIEDDDHGMDWWSRYFGSLTKSKYSDDDIQIVEEDKIVILNQELEKSKYLQTQFQDIRTFELFEGKKRIKKKKSKPVTKFKCAISLEPKIGDETKRVCPWTEIDNKPVAVLVRIYLIRAMDVKPKDLGGKADLYPVLTIGDQKISDKDKYVPNNLNPFFGRVYEFTAQFPQETILNIELKDWDRIGSNDSVGVTKIDLEQRFYSIQRGCVGLPKILKGNQPNVSGWREGRSPVNALEAQCRRANLQEPTFTSDSVKIGDKLIFKAFEPSTMSKEEMALAALNCWENAFGYQLVPEHVETRSIYDPKKPGIRQGKIQLWVDMFPSISGTAPPFNITLRSPKSYELRVIIWNTEDVILDDDSLISGEKMSDIYVKGWITEYKESQSTDVHYRSLTGEGNFNWRFVFPFDYIGAEKKIIIKKTKGLFALNETELKIPAVVKLQVWDDDSFSGDDILGILNLDLNRFPRGSRTAKACNLKNFNDENYPKVNLFTNKRIRGWWPFTGSNPVTGNEELTGKLEAEFELISKEEAEERPAGKGREEPSPLDKPNRPETSFLWFTTPLKSFKYIIWSNHKWALLRFLIYVLLIFFLVLFIYSLPGYTVKRIIGA